MIQRARCNAREAGIERLVEFRQEDLFHTDLRSGTRIVSHRFGLGDWPPERTVEIYGYPLLLWTVP